MHRMMHRMMRRMTVLLPISLLLGAAALLAIESRASADEPSPAPVELDEVDIDDFAWLAGHWKGTGLGGTCEEVWSRPLGGTMMGSFRLVQKEKVVFYELVVLGPDAEGFSMKVKHFSEDFTAWESKEESVRFPLVSIGEREARFNGLTIKRDRDALEIRVHMESGDKSYWETFDFDRYDPESVED